MGFPASANFPGFIPRNRYIVAAAYFLLLQTAYLFVTTASNPSGPALLLYYCNHIPFLLALAFISGRMQAAKAIINLGILIQGAWLVDFLARLVFRFYPLGITNYIFAGAFFAAPNIISIIEHGTTIWVALALTYKIRPRPVSLLYSFLYMMTLYALSLSFTPPTLNVNCVFQACIFQSVLGVPQFTALWPFLVMVLAILGYLIQLWLYRYYRIRTASIEDK